MKLAKLERVHIAVTLHHVRDSASNHDDCISLLRFMGNDYNRHGESYTKHDAVIRRILSDARALGFDF